MSNFPRKVAAFFGVHLLVCGACMTAFAAGFGYPVATVVPLHLGIVALALAGCVLALGLATLLAGPARPLALRLASAALPAAATAALLLLYVGNVLSNHFWGANLHYTLVASHIGRAGAHFAEFPTLTLVACVLPLALFGALAAVYDRWAAGVWREAGAWMRPAVLLATLRSHGRVVAWLSFFSVLGGGYAWAIDWIRLHRLWNGEPLITLVKTYSQLGPSEARLAVIEREREIRAAYRAPADFEPRNVVLIIVDALRADRLSLYGYERDTTPYLAALEAAGELSVLPPALATCSESVCGVLSILGSKDFRLMSPRGLHLHHLLRDLGYAVYFIHADDHHAWYEFRDVLGTGVDYYFDMATSRYRQPDDRIVLEGLEGVPDADGRPAFFYFHLMSAHSVGVRHAAFERYRPAQDAISWNVLVRGGYDPVALGNMYDNGVFQADAFIREILTRLRAKGYMDDALVVITSDHGEGLGERGNFGHTRYLYQEDLLIPVLIHEAEPAGYVERRFPTQLDIAPTILDRLGLPVPETWHGHSLLRDDKQRYTFHRTNRPVPWVSVVYRAEDGVYKYLYHLGDAEEREQLYELLSDPEERRNRVGEVDAALVAELRARAAEHFGIAIAAPGG